MLSRLHSAIVATLALVLLLAGGSAQDAPATPIPVDGASWIDITETGPLPAIPAGAIAALRRITIPPGATLDIAYRGPTLCCIVQGTLGVDVEHRRLTFVGSGDGRGKRGIDIDRHGEIPAGIGVYAADGNLGPTRNAGEGDLVILALLIVPQPSGTALEQAGGASEPAAPKR